ncbi:MAG: 50S ribosomal protein L18 [Candidatus Nanoarchaeia archaeon]|nr:50S ribosomal protein L18 [Candidatus Nanoarchaeia archaeon]MDD5054001.1 50S ribosomal protein L18 [Candidatus Nanoarchaeia archaeon]MDD5499795.1 50S ribosomal protein L18 [Candidatus Nanoarchaeia archaeon]
MATGPRYSVPYKRKRENKTNYGKRLSAVKSKNPRLVVRKTNKRMIAQIIRFEESGDKTIISASNNDLKNHGYTNAPKNIASAYLVGYLIGKMAQKNKIKSAVMDIGLNVKTKGSRIFAVLAGAVKSGMIIPHDEKIFPVAERLKGEHIKGFDSSIIDAVIKSIDSKVKA